MGGGMDHAYRESQAIKDFKSLYDEAFAEYMLLHESDDAPPFQEMMEELASHGILDIRSDKRKGREQAQSGDLKMYFSYDIKTYIVEYSFSGTNKTFTQDYLEDALHDAWVFRQVLLTDAGQKALKAHRRW